MGRSFRAVAAAILVSSSLAWCKDDPKELPGRLGATRACEGQVLLVGPGDETGPYATLLGAAGFTVAERTLDARDLDEAIEAATLVVLAPGIPVRQVLPGGPKDRTFERIRKKKIVAMGDGGANVLDGGDLLVGGSHCWTVVGSPAMVMLGRSLEKTPFASLLKGPCPIEAGVDEEGTAGLRLCNGHESGEHREAYDGGEFPAGTLGIGLGSADAHHWAIAKQGDYVLWGPGCPASSLTVDGERLFVNLCDAMVRASHEELVFPPKRFLEVGEMNGVLLGGHSEIYYVVARAEGKTRVELSWSSANTIHFYKYGPAMEDCDLEEGESPLVLEWEIRKGDVGTEYMLDIHSFDLTEGRECPYVINVSTE